MMTQSDVATVALTTAVTTVQSSPKATKAPPQHPLWRENRSQKLANSGKEMFYIKSSTIEVGVGDPLTSLQWFRIYVLLNMT